MKEKERRRRRKKRDPDLPLLSNWLLLPPYPPGGALLPFLLFCLVHARFFQLWNFSEYPLPRGPCHYDLEGNLLDTFRGSSSGVHPVTTQRKWWWEGGGGVPLMCGIKIPRGLPRWSWVFFVQLLPVLTLWGSVTEKKNKQETYSSLHLESLINVLTAKAVTCCLLWYVNYTKIK
jgi:hypothetical protein